MGPGSVQAFVPAQFANFIQENQAFVRFFEQAGAIRLRPGERSAPMSKQRGHGMVTAQGGAIDFHKSSRQPPALFAQFIDASGEHGLPGPCRTGQQHGMRGIERHRFHLFHQLIERRVFGGNAALEEINPRLLLLGETRCQPVVARQIQIDKRDLPGGIQIPSPCLARRRLQQPSGHVAGFIQEEPANLYHVRARRQVEQVFLLVGIKRICLHPVVKPFEDLLEIPWIIESQRHQIDRCFR